MINPRLAAIISFFLPGIGQIYAGQRMKGVVMFIFAIILYYLVIYYVSLGYLNIAIVFLIYGIFAAYDAYKGAKETTWKIH
jgi:TM2 domain-containing membrane protein YozV